MSTVEKLQSQVEAVYSRERELGFLSLDALRSDCTFAVVEALAGGESPELLSYCPAWVVSELYAWLKMFHEQGHFAFVSNLGEVNHSRLMAAVAAAAPPPEALGPRLNLQAQTTRTLVAEFTFTTPTTFTPLKACQCVMACTASTLKTVPFVKPSTETENSLPLHARSPPQANLAPSSEA